MSGSEVPSSNQEYPPQLHAGKVGIGPHYHPNPTLGEKLTGYVEEVKGTITRDHEKVQHGKEIVSGEEKRKQREEDQRQDPFANTSGNTNGPSQSAQLPHPNQGTAMAKHDDKGMREQAATVAGVDNETET